MAITRQQELRKGMKPHRVSKRTIATKKSPNISNKYKLSSRIIDLIKQNATDEDIKSHIAIEEIARDCNYKTVWDWAEFLLWLYKNGGMSLDTKTSKSHQTVEDLMRKWEIPTPIKTVMRDIKFGKNLGGLP
ncbi:hypothetical protein TSTA_066140 [Talaromyces stipitatus ATCC 10500]|uniref:Uncharacterized protein n=1 Tax=Talaromyces stipitatus (strain ATCC 10500 / CBS 375.48 / QM 6759 / NRRL 1006) TaxID=441959 RepID=B8LVB1_TALSN|nr:uncharacterized protein TSTA_066140 [Talaromyces stipitatus ATCC 10500]EED23161.1 hypothetical protein TSTA_066140 [Talaromyces stipitatus ATCC 10500]